ncbi:MAG: HNH endonuclease [Kiritimatiellae bacterium]|nr:HNH endonuclease [Kiritimatiellia bacterium]
MVKKFFDPRAKDKKVSNLVDCYKEYIDKMSDVSEIRSFVKDVAEFAKTYRNFFTEVKDDELLRWDNSKIRVLHILRTCDVSTFDPLILKLAIEGDDALGVALDELSSYVLRHVVAGATVKNFNKECASVIHGDKTIAKYLEEKKAAEDIDDESVRKGLLHIKKSYNKIAKEILLWMEAKRRAEKGADVKGVLKNHGYDLEHIMPQEWGGHWPITSPMVVDPVSGNAVADPKDATDLRKNAVYEIGNMVLLNGSLNRGVQNREIKVKLNGDGARITGIRNAPTPPESLYTQDVIADIEANGYLWNEKTIRERSEALSDVFLSIW